MGWFRQRARRWWSSARQEPDATVTSVDDVELHDRVAELLVRELGTAEQANTFPTAVSPARIASWMSENQFSYFIDNDGDLGGLWRGRLFYFFLFGEQAEILQVRGQWHRELAIERLEEVLDLCNEWNAERIWPKAYARVRDNGRVHVVAEVATDLEHGATDAQLSQILFCGLSTGSMLFDALDERYPDPAGAAP
ncbi:YbjN domain-containing protein [Cellulomonas wangsupingiae]|uniref:YbjN domain-containing protein n=1 Tax=Cellulomonas wangsupingiae TaxID=2968085 RepID=A0ABY5K850_9CELL|nr:YbjN domain-containing protein [Cellulomonas wangsupingiae]MCC2335233.1 YbjN domain-containing protein [Cellulomonas wangsupingiae]MCM0639147.1 YbjN domain-containing protein [Cellulomonas wangsupingiae]UUI66627.1 YbjN domain-containing protein [Cellulomonas wangsupingiae]